MSNASRGTPPRDNYGITALPLALARIGRDEGGNPPRLRSLPRPLFLRERVLHALHEAGAARGDLLAVPSLLHGQAEARGHRRPGRALPPPSGQARALSTQSDRMPDGRP